MAIPDKVIELIERFACNRDAYRTTPGDGGGAGYNEPQVRREFIDPLFTCFGWDIDNRQGYAEAYKKAHQRRMA